MQSPIQAKGDENKEFIRSLFNQYLRITISDGRVLVGKLLCLDNHENVILAETTEFRPAQTKQVSSEHRRTLGMALLPGKHIIKVESYQQEYS